MSSKSTNAIPSFYLYGDQQQDADLDTLHAEQIIERSQRHDWIIHPHVHPDHTQILWITDGGGRFKIEETVLNVVPNSIVIQPAGMIHEIRFDPETQGRVLTVSVSFINSVVNDDPRLIEMLRRPATFEIRDDTITENMRHAMSELLTEANSARAGRRIAMRAHFLSVLVSLLRMADADHTSLPKNNSKDFQLLTRYRAALEAHFRQEKTLSFYAGLLGVTSQRLNAACKARAGKTASEALYDRIITEAKRGLLYTEMSVAEIGHAIGFDDPAYFNRFFSQRVGVPPGTYRDRAATTQRIGFDGSSNTNL